MKKAILTSCAAHGKNNCLGTIVRKEGQQDSISYLNYDQLLQQSIGIGSGILH